MNMTLYRAIHGIEEHNEYLASDDYVSEAYGAESKAIAESMQAEMMEDEDREAQYWTKGTGEPCPDDELPQLLDFN